MDKKNREVICYDLMILPIGIDLNEIMHISNKTGMLIYDSTKARKAGVLRPYPYALRGVTGKVLLDISTEGGKEIYKRLIKELDHAKSKRNTDVQTGSW